MTAKAEDRRIQRTRALLLSALLDLIVERGYEELTVQDIVDRANVGRSTFYKHFLDKRALLLSGVDGLQGLLTQQRTAQDSRPKISARSACCFCAASPTGHCCDSRSGRAISSQKACQKCSSMMPSVMWRPSAQR